MLLFSSIECLTDVLDLTVLLDCDILFPEVGTVNGDFFDVPGVPIFFVSIECLRDVFNKYDAKCKKNAIPKSVLLTSLKYKNNIEVFLIFYSLTFVCYYFYSFIYIFF